MTLNRSNELNYFYLVFSTYSRKLIGIRLGRKKKGKQKSKTNKKAFNHFLEIDRNHHGREYRSNVYSRFFKSQAEMGLGYMMISMYLFQWELHTPQFFCCWWPRGSVVMPGEKVRIKFALKETYSSLSAKKHCYVLMLWNVFWLLIFEY